MNKELQAKRVIEFFSRFKKMKKRHEYDINQLKEKTGSDALSLTKRLVNTQL